MLINFLCLTILHFNTNTTQCKRSMHSEPSLPYEVVFETHQIDTAMYKQLMYKKHHFSVTKAICNPVNIPILSYFTYRFQ